MAVTAVPVTLLSLPAAYPLVAGSAAPISMPPSSSPLNVVSAERGGAPRRTTTPRSLERERSRPATPASP